jgi:hypothetical protein
MKAARGAVPHPIPLGSCGGWDCRSGASPVEARGNCGRIYPTLHGSQESMLLDPNFRKGGGRVGILGTGEADQGSSFSIGVQFFGALGVEIDII